ncbi:hypothetical protein NHQ30_007890 [Ciborinia camelliae]|nr:hypothetical protein NHQ30_007890 [Ciborinia camelliae]
MIFHSLLTVCALLLLCATASAAPAPAPGGFAVLNSPTVRDTTSDCDAQSELGDFVLNFDDIPPSSVPSATVTDIKPEALLNPYHHFTFSDGFKVVPPANPLPYVPATAPLFLEFLPSLDVVGSDVSTGVNTQYYNWSGQIGTGDKEQTGCFQFNFYAAWVGCIHSGVECIFKFSGYKYDTTLKTTSQVAYQEFTVPDCPSSSGCTLTRVGLDSSFKDLSHVLVNANSASYPKLWWMDELALGWYDNHCSVGTCRATS